MKQVVLLLCLVSSAVSIKAQQLEEQQLDSLKKIWTAEIQLQAKQQLMGTSHNEGWSEFSDSVFNAYEADTFLLNHLLTRHLEADYTDFGMVGAINDYGQGYDRLLNKYYKLLLSRLDKKDQAKLKQSQRNWITLRNSERKLSSALTAENYSGGGTIQRLFYADWNAGFTAHRVEELINYLTRLQ